MSKVKGINWETEKFVWNSTTFHSDHVFCCRDAQNVDSCFMHREGIEVPSAFDAIQSVLKSNSSVCVTWHWRPYLFEFAQFATDVTSMDNPPDAFIFNMGIHDVMRAWADGALPGGFNATIDILSAHSGNTEFMYHTPTRLF